MRPLKYFALLLMALIYWQSSAQDYTPLLSNSNEWQLTNCYFGCLTDAYFTDGDTIVNGMNHKILDGFHYISRTFLLREVVSEKKVYLTRVIDPNTTEEFLLYDFSLSVGDSIEMMNPITPFPPNGGYFVVDSIIPRVLEDGEDYDHFYFSPAVSNQVSFHNAEWVEGIGSMSIINAPGGDPDINGAGHLSCYYRDGISIYRNLDSISNCTPVLSVNDIVPSKPVFITSYSEDNGLLTVRADQEMRHLYLFDIQGNRILDSETQNSKQALLDTTSLSKGIYLLRIQDLYNRIYSLKILVY